MPYMQLTLSGLRAEKDYYTTRELSEIFHVSQHTIRSWVKRGVLQGEQREPTTPGAKTMRGRYRIFPDSVENIETALPELIELSRPYLLRLYAQMLSKKER